MTKVKLFHSQAPYCSANRIEILRGIRIWNLLVSTWCRWHSHCCTKSYSIWDSKPQPSIPKTDAVPLSHWSIVRIHIIFYQFSFFVLIRYRRGCYGGGVAACCSCCTSFFHQCCRGGWCVNDCWYYGEGEGQSLHGHDLHVRFLSSSLLLESNMRAMA